MRSLPAIVPSLLQQNVPVYVRVTLSMSVLLYVFLFPLFNIVGDREMQPSLALKAMAGEGATSSNRTKVETVKFVFCSSDNTCLSILTFSISENNPPVLIRTPEDFVEPLVKTTDKKVPRKLVPTPFGLVPVSDSNDSRSRR